MKLPIPTEALDDRLSIVGRSGYGKTNAAKVMAECLLTAGARVCILDPTDAWWGLRLKPDGVHPGFPVAIFGGQKGDLALNEHAGETIGTAIATSSQSTIVSMADFVGENARRRFASAFLAALYQHNREPLHLIVDEADTLAPQKPIAPLDAEVLSRMQQIVRRGRIRGFVPYLITQRPAVLNKDVLSQADGLIAFNLISSQDRDAIGNWIEGQADKAEQKALLATLPKLERGTAMVWLPGRGILQQVEFPLSATFDSGRTPKRGEAKPTATLKPIDVAGLAGKIAAVEEKRKADDPKALRAEIARLTDEIARHSAASPVDPAKIDDAYQRGVAAGREEARTRYERREKSTIDDIDKALALLNDTKSGLLFPAMPPAPTPGITHRQAPYTPAPAASVPRPPAAPRPAPAEGTLKPALQRVVNAIGWWRQIGQDPVDRSRACVVAGLSPKASTFGVYIGELIKLGLVESSPGKIGLTSEGAALAIVPSGDTREQIHDVARGLLGPQEQRVFDAIYAAHPNEIARVDLANAVGLSPTASTLGVYIGGIAAYGIIENGSRGHVRAAGWLFP